MDESFFKTSSFKTEKDTNAFIDLGVGSNDSEGWIHVDFFRNILRNPFKIRKVNKRPEVETDLRFPLNCKDNFADGVYSGHTLEYLYPDHAYKLLAEIYRILKPGQWLRINEPDLGLAVD